MKYAMSSLIDELVSPVMTVIRIVLMIVLVVLYNCTGFLVIQVVIILLLVCDHYTSCIDYDN